MENPGGSLDLAIDHDKNRTTYFEMLEDIKELLDGNANLPFIKLLKQQGLSIEEEMLFMLVCQRTLTGDPEVDLEHVLGIVTYTSRERIRLIRTIVRGRSRLITNMTRPSFW